MSFKHVWHLPGDCYVLRIRGMAEGFVTRLLWKMDKAWKRMNH